MNDILIAVITAGLAFLGTAVGAYYSNQKTTALVVYRLEQLEEKVNKHNNVLERVFNLERNLEKDEELFAEKMKVVNHRIEDLEEFHK